MGYGATSLPAAVTSARLRAARWKNDRAGRRRLGRLVLILVVVTLLAPGCQTDCLVELTTASPLPDGRVGQAYFLQLQATSSCTPGVAWMERGGLPPGMKLSEDGALDGTPTEAGAFTFRVDVFIFDMYDEYKGQTEDSREYTLTILPRP